MHAGGDSSALAGYSLPSPPVVIEGTARCPDAAESGALWSRPPRTGFEVHA